MNYSRLLASVLLVLILSTALSATTVERLSLEDLSIRAHLIVHGTVRSSESQWTADRKLILTTTIIETTEAIKGQAPRLLQVTTIGGRVGNTVLHVAGMPVFKPGEDAVVFVEQAGACETVLGLGQGKFSVREGQVSNSVSSLTFSDGQPARSVNMQLEAFRAQVRAILNRGK